MIRYGINNIRELVGHKVDIEGKSPLDLIDSQRIRLEWDSLVRGFSAYCLLMCFTTRRREGCCSALPLIVAALYLCDMILNHTCDGSSVHEGVNTSEGKRSG